jgi:hypothetical protein
VLALVLAASQALAPMPPRALHHANGQSVRVRTERVSGLVDWDALERTVTLSCATPRPERLPVERVERATFRPTAAAGLEAGWLALAGRVGVHVCLELWRVVDTVGPAGEPGLAVTERRRVWEQVDADSIELLLWNPVPPAGASVSLRGLWHRRRELVRYDVDVLGWAVPDLEAALQGPTTRQVLHVEDLDGRLARTLQALHPERGLVLMLQSPLLHGGWGCEGPEVSLALLDRDLDGRLDDARRIDGEVWNTEDWGQLDTYERVLDP